MTGMPSQGGPVSLLSRTVPQSSCAPGTMGWDEAAQMPRPRPRIATPPRRPARGRVGSFLAALTLVVLLLLTSGSSWAVARAPTPIDTLGLPTGTSSAAPGPRGTSGWPSFDTGNVTLVFTGTMPSLALFQDTSPSVRTTLAFEHILEVSSSSSRSPAGGPSPVGLFARAYALPSGSNSFSVTVSGGITLPHGVWVNMSGNVTVRALSQAGSAGLPLWESPTGEIPSGAVGGSLGNVNVRVSFHLSGNGTPNHVGAAKVGVVLSGWPWVDPADTLALEWQFFSPGNDTAMVACASSAPPSNGTVGISPCATEMGLGVGQPLWSNSTTAVETLQLGGLVSFVDWTNSGTVTASSGSSQSVPLGAALFPISGSDLVRFLQVLPFGLGSFASFQEDPSVGLVPTLPSARLPTLPPVFQGDLGGFVVALAVGAVAVLALVGVARSRERRRLARM